MAKPLGRVTPSDFSHVERHALDASVLTVPKPVVIGVNWYEDFDNPIELPDGSYHLPEATKIRGSIRGGHCVCLPPLGFDNTPARDALLTLLWKFYDQAKEGACEGFGHAKAQSLERGGTYDAFQLYDWARKVEGTFPSGEGTSNRATVEALLKYGITPQTGPVCLREVNDGPTVKPVTEVKWTKDTQEVLAALGRPHAAAVPLTNNWNVEYPRIVWLPVSTLGRLLSEEGEADCCTG